MRHLRAAHFVWIPTSQNSGIAVLGCVKVKDELGTCKAKTHLAVPTGAEHVI